MISSVKTIKPSFSHALITFILISLIISTGMLYFSISLHILLLIALCVAVISAYPMAENGYTSIRNAMNDGISKALSAIYIFLLIGILIAAFIQSGTIATLIYYGLDILTPEIFLPAGLLLCSFMSLATGTSWGTVGTAGVVLVGIASIMGIPLPIVAGMIISGACFGDKMSPVSDTTVLASMSANVKFYDHIKSMMITTLPTYIITLGVFTFISMQYADTPFVSESIIKMQSALEKLYNLNFITTLPLFVMIFLSYKKTPAEISLFISSVSAVILAVLYQGTDFSTVLNALFSGGKAVDTGIESLNSLLSRGGLFSMMWTLSLALLALMLGGVLHKYNFLNVIITVVLQKIKSAAGLVATTIFTCIFGNAVFGEAYITLILGGQLFKDSYDEKGVKRTVLSRSLEEGATFSAPLIPWTTTGAFFASTLGISVIEYAPWVILNWLNIVVAISIAIVAKKTLYIKYAK